MERLGRSRTDACFSTGVDPSTTATTIESVLARYGYSVRATDDHGQMSVIGTFDKPGYRILLTAKPQHLEWRIASDHDVTRVHFASRYARWYATVLALLGPVSVAVTGTLPSTATTR